MAELEPRVWWADVQHLREPLERSAGARRSERRAGSGVRGTTERRTIKLRGQAAVPGAPRRELRDAAPADVAEPYDIEAVAAAERREVEAPLVARVSRAGPRRPARRARERIGSRPDRIAGWAVVVVLCMGLIAATSARGAAAARVSPHSQHSAAPLTAYSALPARR